jgi:hypothetical protein
MMPMGTAMPVINLPCFKRETVENIRLASKEQVCKAWTAGLLRGLLLMERALV